MKDTIYIIEKYDVETGRCYRQEKDGKEVEVAFKAGVLRKQDVEEQGLRYFETEEQAQQEADFYSQDTAVGGDWSVVEVEV